MARLTYAALIALIAAASAAAVRETKDGEKKEGMDHSDHAGHAGHKKGDDASKADGVDHSNHSGEEHEKFKKDNPDSAAAKADTKPSTSDDPATASDDPATSTDPSTSPEKDDDDDAACFAADATVELASGATIRMEDLSVGDEVKVGPGAYSRVFMFTHKTADVEHAFVTLQGASGAALSATPGHLVFANGALVSAGEVKVGDVLALGSGAEEAVVAVGGERKRGLYNPQTVHGSVVVDGVLASTYTTAVEPAFAHAVLSPLRALNWLGFSFTALESGGGALVGAMPRGEGVF